MSDEKLEASGGQAAFPLLFVENVGQCDPRIRFEVIGGRTKLQLTDEALWLTVVSAERISPRQRVGVSHPGADARLTPAWAVHLRLSFVGSNTKTRPESLAPLPSVVSYLRGADPASWHAKVPVWGGVTYPGLYPGADLAVLSGKSGGLEMHLRAAPEVAVEDVRLRVEGAEFVELGARPGSGKDPPPFEGLHIKTALGRVFVPLISLSRAPTRKPSVEQVGPEAFDVVCPFTW